MIKLNYNLTEEFTSREISDLAEPPLTFKVWRHRVDGWTEAGSAFLEAESARHERKEPQDGQNLDLALPVIALSLVSVHDGEKTHPIGNLKKAKELKKAIEAAVDATYASRYMVKLADIIITRQMEREDRMLAELKKSLPRSSDGAASEPSNGKMEPATSSTATT